MSKVANTETCCWNRLVGAAAMLIWASQLALPAQTVWPFQVQWYKTFGGTNGDNAWRVAVAPDGGYLVTTTTEFYDAWVLRLDSRGHKLWERTLAGGEFTDVKATSNGEWILTGASSSGVSESKTSPNYGYADYWVVRMDDQGNMVWDRSFGGPSYDFDPVVVETSDGGFMVVGTSYESETNEIKIVPSFGSLDIWLLKVSGEGDLLWQRGFGGTGQDWVWAIARLGTNAFVIGGTSMSEASGNKEAPNYGDVDFWIITVDQDGNKLWERSYGGSSRDELLNIRGTSDGGIVACGWTGSGVSGNKTTPLAVAPSFDIWIIRLDSAGNKIWERTVGKEDSDVSYALLQTIDGGFVMGGSSSWTNAWLVRLDANGNSVWDSFFNVAAATGFRDIQSTEDGGIIAVGSRRSAAENILMMKLKPDALIAPELQLLPPVGTSQRLKLRGTPNRSYVTEGSEDLLTWMPFATNTLSSNAVEVLDAMGGSGRRFYRAMMLP